MPTTAADVCILVVVIVFLLYYLGTRKHNYWTKRGVRGPKPSLFLGTQTEIIFTRQALADFYAKVYSQFKDDPYVGLLDAQTPVLMVKDLELVKHVLTKDFTYFHDRGVSLNEKVNPLQANLSVLSGIRWRQLRLRLTPTFTSSKIKRMFPLMKVCSEELVKVLEPMAECGEEVEIKDLIDRFTTDVIGSCAFGIECNSLKDPNAEFRRVGMEFFEVTPISRLRRLVYAFSPWLAGRWPSKTNATNFFLKTVRETVSFREKNNVHRDDFMDLLIEIKKKGRIVDDAANVTDDAFTRMMKGLQEEDLEFTENLMAAQAFVFFLAGFETSSTTMSFCLLELAHNRDIQEAAQREIDQVLAKNEGELTYEALMDMPYLDKVAAETLRKYPALPLLTRVTAQKYHVPESKLVLERGTKIHIPLHAIHNDPDIYPEPEKFDPERFAPDAKLSRHPYAYLPFGEGPRICIGSRFGQLQVKLGLASVLSQFDLAQLPVKFKSGSFLTAIIGGCHLRITKRSKVT